jgi:cytochrome oxidase Cu insertion factor (SCO1/SenC/PrrC family)
MRGMKKRSPWIGAIAALWAGVAVGGSAQARELKAGDKMPNFTLTDINGKKVSLAQFKNRAVWLAFFHST